MRTHPGALLIASVGVGACSAYGCLAPLSDRVPAAALELCCQDDPASDRKAAATCSRSDRLDALSDGVCSSSFASSFFPGTHAPLHCARISSSASRTLC